MQQKIMNLHIVRGCDNFIDSKSEIEQLERESVRFCY